MKGEVYMGFSKKSGKIKQNMPRKAKSLKEACTSKKCLNSKLRYCKEFTEQCRSHIFKKFWGMTWDQRKVFVASHVFKTPTFKSNKENSRRQGTYTYYLHDGNENLQVYRTMFTNTLDIGYKTIHYWVDNSSCGMTDESSCVSTKKMVQNRYTESHKYLEQFFESLPKLPSHYCRNETQKLYLEYSFTSMSDLYGVYVNSFCQEKNITPLGRNVFSQRFKENNFALYTPKETNAIFVLHLNTRIRLKKNTELI
uniref:Uncharacterized protein LOC114348822 n=1 Tax=Diabrotica virgifera virgifera TaxID=50390 RepID=A0A6P7H905_DIAVI